MVFGGCIWAPKSGPKKRKGSKGERRKLLTRNRVVHWNDGMCGDCWDRLVAEAREQAAEAKRADREAEELAAASVSSRSESTPSSSAWSR